MAVSYKKLWNHASYLLRKLTQAGGIELVHRSRYPKYKIKETI